MTFVYSARAGWEYAISDATVVPIRERFFVGGATTVRGFTENSIGPRDEFGNITGGDFAIILNAELRFPLVYGFGGVVFVDGGSSYLVQCDSQCRRERNISDGAVSFENFRRSAGLGLRYTTPVGSVGLDYGFKLDRRSGESIGEIHFNIGATF